VFPVGERLCSRSPFFLWRHLCTVGPASWAGCSGRLHHEHARPSGHAASRNGARIERVDVGRVGEITSGGAAVRKVLNRVETACSSIARPRRIYASHCGDGGSWASTRRRPLIVGQPARRSAATDRRLPDAVLMTTTFGTKWLASDCQVSPTRTGTQVSPVGAPAGAVVQRERARRDRHVADPVVPCV